MAYSEDLRERVLGFVEKGTSKEEAAERYGVGVSTVYWWCKTPEKVKAAKPGPKGCSKLDLDGLAILIEERPTAYQEELAAPLGVSRATLCRGLKRLKLTRKKTTHVEKNLRVLSIK